MKTEFNEIICDWRRVKNHCRTTENKDFTENEPSESFKKMLLISEHSPIRLIEYDWSWRNMPYWVHAELARHKFEKFISSQRDDRVQNEIPRGKKPQDAPVRFDGYANQQNLIDAWRKRLCFKATPEARAYCVSFKLELWEAGYKAEADVLVPHCVYRCGCPEPKPCGFFDSFVKHAELLDVNLFDIQNRYDLYNDLLRESQKGVIVDGKE